MKPVKTRLVLFDIDGTLIRTGGAGIKAFARTAAEVFDCPGGTSSMRFHGRTDVSLVREFLIQNAIPDNHRNVGRFLDAYLVFLDEELRYHRGKVCPGVMRLLDDLAQSEGGPLVALLTGNIRGGAGLKLGSHGLKDRFEFGAYGDDHENRNELARIAVDRGSERLGRHLCGSEVVIIGDTLADIECARSVGAYCVAVATGGNTLAELLEHSPALAVEDLTEVPSSRLMSLGTYRGQPTDWGALYQSGDTFWDKGEPAPGLVDFLEGKSPMKGQKILIPGCGRAHDVGPWIELGCEVVAVDLVDSAMNPARERYAGEKSVRFLQGDFLDDGLSLGQFEWVFEHTLWCAIRPEQRAAYVHSLTKAVRPGGYYLAINYLQPSSEEGPPFATTLEELGRWLSPNFELMKHWLPRSFEGRAGRERMLLWRRR